MKVFVWKIVAILENIWLKKINFISHQNLINRFPQDPWENLLGGLRSRCENKQKYITMLWKSENQGFWNIWFLKNVICKSHKRYIWAVLWAWFCLISKDIAQRLHQSLPDNAESRSDSFICRNSLVKGEVMQAFLLTTCQCISTQPQRNHF